MIPGIPGSCAALKPAPIHFANLVPRAVREVATTNSPGTTGLKNVCACAACHGARSLGITTSHIKMAAFSKFCEWPPVFREKVEFA